jgi:L-fuculose-phosphate aldolase
MVAIAGGCDIPLARYALFGSEALSKNIIEVMQQRNACLLETHGMLAAGDGLSSAFNLAVEVETLARQYCEALKLGGVTYLSRDQMAEVIEKFKHYGKRD